MLWMLACYGWWHALDDGMLWMMTCSGWWPALDDGMLWMMACSGWWHALDDGMLWMMACSGWWHALDYDMLWMMACSGWWHALDDGKFQTMASWRRSIFPNDGLLRKMACPAIEIFWAIKKKKSEQYSRWLACCWRLPSVHGDYKLLTMTCSGWWHILDKSMIQMVGNTWSISVPSAILHSWEIEEQNIHIICNKGSCECRRFINKNRREDRPFRKLWLDYDYFLFFPLWISPPSLQDLCKWSSLVSAKGEYFFFM